MRRIKAPHQLISKAPIAWLARMELPCVLEEAVKTAGFGPLKAKQQEAPVAFVSGKDMFVALPTGYGKSIIYAILLSVFDNI